MPRGLADALAGWSLTDTGKLIVMFFAARSRRVTIDHDDVDTYAYLLVHDRLIRFLYPFRFQNGPFSDELRDDMEILERADYLKYHSPVRLTRNGSTWARTQVGESRRRKQAIERIGDKIRYYTRLSPEERFNLAYMKMTGYPVPV